MIKKPFENKLSFIGSLIQAGTSIIGGLLGASSSKNAVREANRGNLELAKYGYAANLEQWHRENEYNSPSMQMYRLKQAGLNPNLVYGNGQAVTKSAASPDFKPPTMQSWSGSDYGMTNAGNAVQTYLAGKRLESDIAKQLEETNNLRTQNDYMKQQITNLTLDMANKEIRNARDEFDLNVAKELRDVSIQTAKEGLRKLQADTELSIQRHLESEELVKKLRSETDLNEVRARKVARDIDEVSSRIAVNTSIRELNESRKEGQDLTNKFNDETFETRKQKIEKGLVEIRVKAYKEKWSALRVKAELEHFLKTNGFESDDAILGRTTKALAPGEVNADNYYLDNYGEYPYSSY